MSVEKNYYIIVGYDITDNLTDHFYEWRRSEQSEEYFCFKTPNYVQMFDDATVWNSDSVYLGYVLACGDEYYFDEFAMSLDNIVKIKDYITEYLFDLHSKNVITHPSLIEDFKLICIEENY